ncbi:MAG TPA: hypothetical protein VMF30_13310 [Pirellulales bacterium]|nr:hypothetical protein [Pirellulales bacterium]
MIRLRTLVAVGMVLMLANDSYAAKGAGKRGKHGVGGTVASVSENSLTLKVRKKKKDESEAVEKTFPLNSETKFEFATIKRHGKGEKPDVETSPATAGDLKTGAVVRLTTGEGAVVTKVSIIKHERKDKGKGKDKDNDKGTDSAE